MKTLLLTACLVSCTAAVAEARYYDSTARRVRIHREINHERNAEHAYVNRQRNHAYLRERVREHRFRNHSY